MSTLAGTGPLMRLMLRRDRVVMPAWVLWLGVLPLITARAWDQLYPTQTELVTAAKAVGTNPAFLALFGPVPDASIGGLVAWRLSIVMVVLAVISLLTVIRHTRVEEESGRRELIGSTPVGRHAPLAAALLEVVAANIVVGILATAGLVAYGLQASGSIAFGVAFAASGVVFAGLGGVAAQLTESAGGARAIGLAAIGLAYVVRAAGDASGGDATAWFSWLSPLGWVVQVRSFGGDRWWLFVPVAVLALVLVGAAFVLASRRDVDAGVLSPRLGPAIAAPGLASAWALAWRLHRGVLVGWTVGLAVLGVIYGSVAQGVGNLLADSPELQDIFRRLGGSRALIDAYLAGIMSVLALITTAYAVQAAMRPRTEEEGQRAEPVLATAVPRTTWLASHMLFGFVGPAIALASASLTAGLAYGIVAGDVAGQLPRVIGAGLVNLPAVWLLTGVTIALFGIVPRLMAASWVLYAGIFLVTFFGPVFQLDQWVLDLSPFTHVPKLPGAAFVVAPLAWLAGLAIVTAVGGVLGFRRRDVTRA